MNASTALLPLALFLGGRLFGQVGAAGPLEVGNVPGAPGETVAVPVHAAFEHPLILMQVAFEYDSSRLKYLGYDVAGSAAEGVDPLAVGYNFFDPGVGTFGLYDVGEPISSMFKVPPGERQHLGSLRFLVLARASAGAAAIRPILQVAATSGVGTSYSLYENGSAVSYQPSELIAGSIEVLPPAGLRPVGELACTQFLDRARLTFTLTESYDRLEVRRDGDLVGTLPGSATEFSESLPGLGTYTYSVLASRGDVSSLPVQCVLVATAPTAPPVQELTCGDGGLAWSNPVSYDSLAVFRDGELIAELPGSFSRYVDPERPDGLTIYSVVGELKGFRSPEVSCLDHGIWILEVGDVEAPVDAARVVIPIYATTSALAYGLGFCLQIDATRFKFVRDFDAAIEGTVGDPNPEFLAMGAQGACGHPAAGLIYDYNPPRNPEKNLQVGLRQHVLSFIFSPIGSPAPGETFDVELLSHVVAGQTSFIAPSGQTQLADVLIPGRVRFGSTGVNAVKDLEAEVAHGGDGGGGGAGSDVVLTWRNPSRYDTIRVERNGRLLAEIAGKESGFVDSQVPAGVFTYKVVAVDGGRTSFPASTLLATLAPRGAFLRGDTSRDGAIDIGDPIATLTFLFLGAKALPCEDAADANDDGALGISDAIATLSYLFLGTAVLRAPGTRYPWFDPTEDGLGCAN